MPVVFEGVSAGRTQSALPAVHGSRRAPATPRAAIRLTAMLAMMALSALPLAAQSAPPPARAPAAPAARAPAAPAASAPAASVAPGAAAAPAAPTVSSFAGIWIDDTGDGAVEIMPCATAGPGSDQFCGHIVWLKNPNDKAGRPLRDGNNEDTKERRRSICGLPTIGGLKRQAGGTLDDGWIYDPRRGQRFDLELTMKGPDKLQVVGYKGFKFLSKTFLWTRAPATLPRCVPPV